MASTAVVLGVGLAAVGLAGRALSRRLPDLERNMAQTAKRLAESTPSKYYRGGFETQMTKREASLILGEWFVSFRGFLFINVPVLWTMFYCRLMLAKGGVCSN